MKVKRNNQPLSVSLSGVWAGYRQQPILKDITLTIDPGDYVGVIGPNGCGKSTLLKVILGLIQPAKGEVLVGSSPPAKMRKRIGYLPQLSQIDFNFPATVWDVVMMGRYGRLGLGRAAGQQDKEAARAAIEQVGLSGQLAAPIGQLSGGQRQRAFIARALAQEPDLLVLDEPITAVDVTTQHALTHLLEELSNSGITIISSTHDLNCVASSFNRVVCLNNRLVAIGAPEEVFRQDILNETYGSHLLIANAGDRPGIVSGHGHEHGHTHGPETGDR
jgi:ABC-type Mn2+/Zn2+ transport system ATPase subunit